MPSVKQADALWLDVNVPLYGAFDSTWANWEGIYEISSTETSTPLKTGSLTRNTEGGRFYLRLPYTDATWAAITAQKCKIMYQITNTTIGYREELHEPLLIKVQGLT